MGHLNRRQLPNLDGIAVILLFLDVLVIELHNAPDTAAKQPVVFLWVFIGNRHSFDPQIGELCFIDIALDVQANCDLVDDGKTATGTKNREDFLCLIRTHKVICQNALHMLNALFDDFFVVGAAILPKKELQDVNRHIRPFLDFLREVFADNLAVKVFAEFTLNDFA